jgi:hypothetical protein
MRASDWLCPFVRRPADALHHVSGRAPDGSYFDPALVVPLAHRPHLLEHVAWRVAGIEDSTKAPGIVLRLRRTGHFWVRLGQHHEDGLVELPAPTVCEHGFFLHRIADELEQRR